LPCGYVLGLTDILGAASGPRGLWIGLVIGLTVAAVLLLITVKYVMMTDLKNLINDQKAPLGNEGA